MSSYGNSFKIGGLKEEWKEAYNFIALIGLTGTVHYCGGLDPSSNDYLIECMSFDMATNTWEWANHDLTAARAKFSTVQLDDNNVLLLGGNCNCVMMILAFNFHLLHFRRLF